MELEILPASPGGELDVTAVSPVRELAAALHALSRELVAALRVAGREAWRVSVTMDVLNLAASAGVGEPVAVPREWWVAAKPWPWLDECVSE